MKLDTPNLTLNANQGAEARRGARARHQVFACCWCQPRGRTRRHRKLLHAHGEPLAAPHHWPHRRRHHGSMGTGRAKWAKKRRQGPTSGSSSPAKCAQARRAGSPCHEQKQFSGRTRRPITRRRAGRRSRCGTRRMAGRKGGWTHGGRERRRYPAAWKSRQWIRCRQEILV